MDHTISLATADRRRSLAFYRDGLGLEAFGPLAEDGAPEPLQLRLGPSVSIMPIPPAGSAALSAGGTSIYEPSQQEWGAFAAQVADPRRPPGTILVSPSDWSD
jgi:catechol 2,3-dioxygenase-like lactoylglutathione lyase family enzyme